MAWPSQPELRLGLRKQFQEMTEKKFTFADTFRVDDYEEEMHQLLLLIAGLKEWVEDKQGWVDSCLVSDESQLRDFFRSGYFHRRGEPVDAERMLKAKQELEEKLKVLGDKLGFPVGSRDYMASIAAKMREMGKQMEAKN
jgi:hypothetical protein